MSDGACSEYCTMVPYLWVDSVTPATSNSPVIQGLIIRDDSSNHYTTGAAPSNQLVQSRQTPGSRSMAGGCEAGLGVRRLGSSA